MRASLRCRTVAITCAALMGWACGSGDSGGASGPTASPVALALVAPDTLVDGQDFTLVVRALDAGGSLDAQVSGSVQLEAGAGTLAPTSAVLDAGEATVTARLSGATGQVILRARAGSVDVERTATVLGAGQPVRLEIVPGALLLTSPGTTQSLQAVGRNAAGQVVPVSATWESSRPSTVSITPQGVATAVAGGSALVTARAAGLTSAPALALVATPATGVIVVPDSVIVGNDIEPVDTLARVRVGWQYRVRLRGDAPTVGQLLIGAGATPILGRVTSVSSAGGVHTVTLELRPLAELLPGAKVSETMPFDPARATLNPELRSTYRLERVGRRMRLLPTSGGTLVPRVRAAEQRRGRLRQFAFDSATFRLGPLTCKLSTTVLPRLTMEFPTFEFDPGFDFQFDLDAGQGTLEALVIGNMAASVALQPRLQETFGAQMTCKEPDMVRLVIPINGPLSLLVGGYVPIGGGFKLAGSMTIAQFGFDIELGVDPTLRLGLTCASGACVFPHGLDFNPTASAKPVLPDITSQFRINLEAYPFATFGLAFGGGRADVWDLLGEIELIAGQAGFAQTADLAPASVQVADAAYASTYRLSSKGEIGAGEFATDAIEALREALSLPEFEVPGSEFGETISRTPSGRLAVSPTDVSQGDTVTVTVTLDTTTYLTAYAVNRISVQRRRDTPSGGVELTPLAGPCGDLQPTPGQSSFTCRAEATDTGRIELRAFVSPRLYGVAPPTPLEIGVDARAELTVTAGAECSQEILSSVSVRTAQDLAALANVRRIASGLQFYAYPAAVIELACLAEIGGTVQFFSASPEPTGPIELRFPRLTSIGGGLSFSSYTTALASSFEASFPVLASIGEFTTRTGALQVFSGGGGVSKLSVPSLISIGNNLQLQGGQLRDFDAGSLQRTGSSIQIQSMGRLERVTLGPVQVGLNGGVSVLQVQLNGASFTSLNGISSGVRTGTLIVTDNLGFSDVAARAFRNRITADTAFISRNTGP